MSKCYACGETIRRGYPMVTDKEENVIICERCKRLWRKAKAEEEKAKGTDAIGERKDFQVIVNGNCTKCGKPLSGNRIFICEECEEQNKESE